VRDGEKLQGGAHSRVSRSSPIIADLSSVTGFEVQLRWEPDSGSTGNVRWSICTRNAAATFVGVCVATTAVALVGAASNTILRKFTVKLDTYKALDSMRHFAARHLLIFSNVFAG